MTEQRRDWDKEMADIDRAIAKQGTSPAAGAGAPGARTPGPSSSPRAIPAGPRGSVAITWLWVLLAVALGVALPLWPYQRACGLQAVFFLGAAGVTVLVGGLAHVIALAVIAWAGIVAAGEILPRTGYAREVRTWTCAAAPAPAPAPAAAPTATPAPQSGPAPATQSQPDSAPVSR